MESSGGISQAISRETEHCPAFALGISFSSKAMFPSVKADCCGHFEMSRVQSFTRTGLSTVSREASYKYFLKG